MCCKLGTAARAGGRGGGVEGVTHCVTPRHSGHPAPWTQKLLPKKVRGMSHQQLHPQQPGEGPKGTRGSYRTPAESATSQPGGGAGLPEISNAACVPALRKHMLEPERQTNQSNHFTELKTTLLIPLAVSLLNLGFPSPLALA